MRRLIALLVLWVGLLGATSPAVACAAASLAGDCCPPDAPSDCSETYQPQEAPIAICCASPSVPSQAASMESPRQVSPAQDDQGSPDPWVIAAWLVASTSLNQRPEIITPVFSAYTDATLTYLHTGRLRL